MPPSGREVAQRAVTEGAGAIWDWRFCSVSCRTLPQPRPRAAAPSRREPKERYLLVGRGLAPAVR